MKSFEHRYEVTVIINHEDKPTFSLSFPGKTLGVCNQSLQQNIVATNDMQRKDEDRFRSRQNKSTNSKETSTINSRIEAVQEDVRIRMSDGQTK